MDEKPLVGVVMGSQSDWDVMQHAARVLKDFGVPYEASVVSAHRTPDAMFEYAENARGRGLACIIAGAGGAAHLPGMVASATPLPVIGVPVPLKYLVFSLPGPPDHVGARVGKIADLLEFIRHAADSHLRRPIQGDKRAP